MSDIEAILDARDQVFLLGGSKYSTQRNDLFLEHWYRMDQQVVGLDGALADPDATEGIVRWIHQSCDRWRTFI